ncbi:MAG: hypothetical protein U0Y82_12925 [Thermoleophilia bacterium]
MSRRAILAAGALLGASAPAMGAGSWSAPQVLAHTNSVLNEVHLGVGSDGRAAATWVTGQGTGRVALRPPGAASFAAGTTFPGSAGAPGLSVSVDARGTARILMQAVDMELSQSTFSTPFTTTTLTDDAGSSERALAVDPDGALVAAWLTPNATLVRSQPAGGPLGPAVTIFGRPVGLSVATDPAGDAAAVWFDGLAAQPVVRALILPAGSTVPLVTQMSATGASAADPRIGMDAAGDAVALWTAYADGHFALFTARRPAGGDWSTLKRLSPSGTDTGQSALSVAATGRAVAVWTAAAGRREVVQAATVDVPGGDWSTATTISRGRDDADHPVVVVTGTGSAIAAWRRVGGTGSTSPPPPARPAGAGRRPPTWRRPRRWCGTSGWGPTPPDAPRPCG